MSNARPAMIYRNVYCSCVEALNFTWSIKDIDYSGSYLLMEAQALVSEEKNYPIV